MNIKAKGKLDVSSMTAFVRFTMFRRGNPGKRMLLLSIVYAILLAALVAEIIVLDADVPMFVLLGALAFLFLIALCTYFVLPKMQYNALGKMKDAENEYTFCDDVLHISSHCSEYRDEATVEYTLFVRAWETSGYLFLWQTKNQVFLLDKSTVTGGSVEEIREKLSSYLGKKYVIRRD